jgi:adenylate kinase family enzyme
MFDRLKIAVIGNACGGKTRLSRRLAEIYGLPLIHVDRLQYTDNLQLKPFKETIQLLQLEQKKASWVIDGFGPLDILEERLKLADIVVMIDLPVWRHYFWAVKRVIKNIFSGQRSELPPDCNERNIRHIAKLFKTIHQIHTKMRPEMLRILNRDVLKPKTILIRDLDQWSSIYKDGPAWDGVNNGNTNTISNN